MDGIRDLGIETGVGIFREVGVEINAFFRKVGVEINAFFCKAGVVLVCEFGRKVSTSCSNECEREGKEFSFRFSSPSLLSSELDFLRLFFEVRLLILSSSG